MSKLETNHLLNTEAEMCDSTVMKKNEFVTERKKSEGEQMNKTNKQRTKEYI